MKIWGVKRETDRYQFHTYYIFKNRQEVTIDRITTAYVTFLGFKIHWTKRINNRCVYYLPIQVNINYIPVEF